MKVPSLPAMLVLLAANLSLGCSASRTTAVEASAPPMRSCRADLP
jgi:hypothetical protein